MNPVQDHGIRKVTDVTTPHDIQFLTHFLLATAMGIMLWSLCRRGSALVCRTPQLWAAAIGFAIAWLAQSVPQIALGQPLSPGLLPADYLGIIFGQTLASLYLLLTRRLAPHPQSPVSCLLSRAAFLHGQHKLVLVTSENEWSLPGDRGRDHDIDRLRLVA